MRQSKSTKPSKPIAPIQSTLYHVWFLWLIYRLVIYPLLISFSLSSWAVIFIGAMWQILVLLPALLLTPTIKKGNSPYGLIMASLITLIYLGLIGLFLFIRIYENAPFYISIGFGIETVLLFIINILLFILLKRLPSMHKTQITN